MVICKIYDFEYVTYARTEFVKACDKIILFLDLLFV